MSMVEESEMEHMEQPCCWCEAPAVTQCEQCEKPFVHQCCSVLAHGIFRDAEHCLCRSCSQQVAKEIAEQLTHKRLKEVAAQHSIAAHSKSTKSDLIRLLEPTFDFPNLPFTFLDEETDGAQKTQVHKNDEASSSTSAAATKRKDSTTATRKTWLKERLGSVKRAKVSILWFAMPMHVI